MVRERIEHHLLVDEAEPSVEHTCSPFSLWQFSHSLTFCTFYFFLHSLSNIFYLGGVFWPVCKFHLLLFSPVLNICHLSFVRHFWTAAAIFLHQRISSECDRFAKCSGGKFTHGNSNGILWTKVCSVLGGSLACSIAAAAF